MKGKVILCILIGLFLGLGLTYVIYDKLEKKEVTEQVLTWDLYKEYIDQVRIISSSYNPNTKNYGIYKLDNTTKKDLEISDKVRIIISYMQENNLIEDSFIKDSNYEVVSKLLFNEIVSFSEINLDKNYTIKRNNSHNGYEIITTLDKIDSNYYILNDKIKGAYEYGDLIYFDLPITFVQSTLNEDGSNAYKYSIDSKFDTVFCEGNSCERKLKSIVYRISFKKNGINYYFESCTKLGSE